MKIIEYLYASFLLMSMVMIYFAYRHYVSTKVLLNDGIKTKAKVIDLIIVNGDNGYTYRPVFEYLDKKNNLISFESQVSSSPPKYRVGETVSVIYSKNSDERKVVSYWGLYRWTILLLAFASPFLIIGGGYFLYTQS